MAMRAVCVWESHGITDIAKVPAKVWRECAISPVPHTLPVHILYM